jgi:hypothetical protein
VTSIGQKADYVRARMGNGGGRHHCHWPGCERSVDPSRWGCKDHWFKLPLALRRRIWATFRPGQEVTKTPSAEYLKVANEVQAWIRERGG